MGQPVKTFSEDLFCAPQAMVNKAKRRMKFPKDESMPSAESLLTPAQLARLKAHRAATAGRELEGRFHVDLSHQDRHRNPSAHIPTIVQNSMAWSEVLKREALPMEHLIWQGVPCSAAPETARTYQVAWPDVLLQSSPSSQERDMKSLAGLAVHINVVGTVFAYCVASTSFGQESLRFRSLTSTMGLQAEDASDCE